MLPLAPLTPLPVTETPALRRRLSRYVEYKLAVELESTCHPLKLLRGMQPS